MIRIWIVLGLLLGAAAARAEDGQRAIGTWLVSEKGDRFGAGGTFLAATPDIGGAGVFGVRCIEGILSFAVIDSSADPHPLETSTAYVIKLRTDKEPVITTRGKAISDRLIQIEAQADMVRVLRKGRETAVRIESEAGVSRTMIFKTVANTKALGKIAAECKVD